MKYYLDTEFLEGEQSRRVFGIKIGNTKPTIDLISIGLVAEDGREYYAISKDFNINEAWDRYDLKCNRGVYKDHCHKVYWIRDNVLFPIYKELFVREKAEMMYLQTPSEIRNHIKLVENGEIKYDIPNFKNCKRDFKRLIKKYGKTNKHIASEIIDFVNPYLSHHISEYDNTITDYFKLHNVTEIDGYVYAQPEFYTYYGDYDWVVFCWIFGKMIDLPKGFPKYSVDLKQILDEKALTTLIFQLEGKTIKDGITELKKHPEYPQQTNEHNALSDAHWNKKLHEFLIK